MLTHFATSFAIFQKFFIKLSIDIFDFTLTKIQVITFDLWKTLLEPISIEKNLIESLHNYSKKKQLSFSSEQIKQALTVPKLDYKKHRDLPPYSHFYTEDRLILILNQLGQKSIDELEKNLLYDFEMVSYYVLPTIIESARDLLENFSKNYRIGLISDTGMTPGKIIIQILEELDLRQFFDAFVFSDEVGFYKPNSKMFQTALSKLESNPDESIHIGDYLHTDIIGAQSFGMKTIWINRHEARKNIVDVTPDFIVENLLEILPIINNF